MRPDPSTGLPVAPRFVAALVLCVAVADLAAQGLPPVPVPAENPITADKAVLGKILFWDEQLSADDTIACGTCHRPEAAGGDPRVRRHPGYDGVFFTADDVFASPGVVHLDASRAHAPVPGFGLDLQVTGRSSPSAITSQWAPEQFWDGRAPTTFVDPVTGLVSIAQGGSLEVQALGPLQNPVEMAHDARPWNEITQKLANARPLALAVTLPPDVQAALQRDPSYPALFARAFGTPAVTAERIAWAIATYERTLVPDQTPYDRFVAGQTSALTRQQRQGMNAFDMHGCTICHPAPFFTDHSFRNLGLRPWVEDPGRMSVTGAYGDRGKFKVPSLRNVGLRSTFMHNGAFATWQQVLDFYDHRLPTFPDNQDPAYLTVSVPAPIRLAIQDFLQNGLTDPRVAQRLPPFDRPTMRSEQPPNQAYGSGTAGTGGLTPGLIARQPASVGAVDFRIGLRGALGSAPALLFVSAFARSYPALPVAVDVDLDAGVGLAATTAGSGGGGGYATWQLPLPNVPSLKAAVLHVQAFVVDPAATIGIASSAAVRIPVL